MAYNREEYENHSADKATVFEKVTNHILSGDKDSAKNTIIEEYPFIPIKHAKRSYTVEEKMEQFLKDGFIDRYSGERLVNPGIFKVLSNYFPEEFPYHPHGKTTEAHIAYWEMFPTIDHKQAIAKGGEDEKSNWVTTSMLKNGAKSHWTLEQLQWEIYDPGNLSDWDGLTGKFIAIVENDAQNLLADAYIKRWYDASKKLYRVPNGKS
ncbi:MAG: HNH endonuclease [Sarcina sp.]|nr:HNH endonuclease [Sarcina sp.]